MIYDYKTTAKNASLKLSFSKMLELKNLTYGSPKGGEE